MPFGLGVFCERPGQHCDMQVRELLEEGAVRGEVIDESRRGRSHLLDSQVAPCSHVTESARHTRISRIAVGVCSAQRAASTGAWLAGRRIVCREQQEAMCCCIW
jgi:hypothetical protein